MVFPPKQTNSGDVVGDRTVPGRVKRYEGIRDSQPTLTLCREFPSFSGCSSVKILIFLKQV